MNTLKSYIFESLLDMDNIDNSNALIEEFLKENCEIKGTYTIKDGVVDVKGDIWLVNKNSTSLTNGLFRFGKIKGLFNCSNCKSLKSLEGAPRAVDEFFDCHNCYSLVSLKGAPKEVERFFDCGYCISLMTLKGAPEKPLKEGFYCYNCNALVSLKGAPRKIEGSMYCNYCKSLKSLEGAPREVGGFFYCNNCGKEFTEEEVAAVCKVGKSIFV